MPFKLDATARHALTGFSVLELAGPEAIAFAQAQFMSDLRTLAVGRWQWSGWLTPKGRVIALFALLKLAEDRLWAVLPDFPADEFAARLQRFVFRSKVKLAVRGDMAAAAAFDADADIAADARNVVRGGVDDGMALDFGGDGGSRFLVLLPQGHAALRAADPQRDLAWRRADVAHGLPRLDAGQIEAWTPQMLSLERLRAYSVKKGCYPGQEIVARTHFLGQAKRGLVRLTGGALAAGAAVFAEAQPVGSVICTAGDEGLCVLQLERSASPLRCGDAPCTPLPPLDGLARG